jgi:hypothetical protein
MKDIEEEMGEIKEMNEIEKFCSGIDIEITENLGAENLMNFGILVSDRINREEKEDILDMDIYLERMRYLLNVDALLEENLVKE